MVLKRVMKTTSSTPHMLAKQKKARGHFAHQQQLHQQHHHQQQQQQQQPTPAMESLAVALKSFPTGSPPPHAHHPYLQSATLASSSTPLSSRAERHELNVTASTSTTSPSARANGNYSNHSATATAATDVPAGEVPKLTIKLKPFQPSKVSQSGFPFIFANSDSDHSQPVRSLRILQLIHAILPLPVCLFSFKGPKSESSVKQPFNWKAAAVVLRRERAAHP